MKRKKAKTVPQSVQQNRRDRRQTELLTGAAAAALVVCMFIVSSIDRYILQSNQYAAVVAAVLVDLANNDRASQKVDGLTVSPVLTAAAQAKADDMAAKGYFAHTSPGGHDSWYWFTQAGYAFSYAGENLAVDFSDSGDVNVAWMNSPEHRINILDPHFTEIGIATAEGSYNGHPTTFVVQLFGTPAQNSAQAAAPAIVSSSNNPTDTIVASKPRVVDTNATKVLGQTAPKKRTATVSANVQLPTATAIVEKPTEHYAPAWAFLVTSPATTLRYLYYLICALVLTVLVVTTGFELHARHRRKFIIACTLFIFMCALFAIGNWFVFTPATIAERPAVTQAI